MYKTFHDQIRHGLTIPIFQTRFWNHTSNHAYHSSSCRCLIRPDNLSQIASSELFTIVSICDDVYMRKGKEDFISGTSTRPASTYSKFRTWSNENCMVMSWLIKSMTPKTGENFIFYSTTTYIWEVTRDTYSSKDNTSELFAIDSSLQELRQGDSDVTSYFTALTRLWQQLDIFEIQEWKFPDDGNLYRAIVEKKRIFKFISGLNSMDDARRRILGTKPLPNLRCVFSKVRHEESRHSSCWALSLRPHLLMDQP